MSDIHRLPLDSEEPLTEYERTAPYKLPKGWSDMRDYFVNHSTMSNAEKRQRLLWHDHQKRLFIEEYNSAWAVPAALMVALIATGALMALSSGAPQ